MHSPSLVDHSSLTWLSLGPLKMKMWPDIFLRGLHICGKAVEAVAHVSDVGNEPDFCSC